MAYPDTTKFAAVILQEWQEIVTEMLTSSAAPMFLLHRWAFHRAKRAENTAVSLMGAQNRLAVGALIVKLACIGGHGFLRGEAAVRAGQHGFENRFAHSAFTSARWIETCVGQLVGFDPSRV
jgi:hypothetical protein